MFKSTIANNYPRIGDTPEQQKLRKAIARFDKKAIALSELMEVEDQVTREVMTEQERAGLDLLTDGQIRWEDALTTLTKGLTGFSHTGLIRYFDTNTYYRQPVAEKAVRWEKPILVRDFEFARKLTSRPVKAILTGPYTLARLSLDRHYGSLAPFVSDVARALNREALALEAAGAQFIQVDEPALCRHKEDLSLAAEAVETVVSGITRAATSLLTCFGDVCWGLERLDRLPVRMLGLDLTTNDHYPRALAKLGSFSKELALGILDARNTRLESLDDRMALLGSLGSFLKGREIHLQPSAGLEFLPRAVACAKMELLTALTRKANEVFA